MRKSWKSSSMQRAGFSSHVVLWLAACSQALSAREDRRFEVQARETALQKAVGKGDEEEQHTHEAALRQAEQHFAVVHQSCLQDVARVVVGVSAQLRAALAERVQLQGAQAADSARTYGTAADVLRDAAAQGGAEAATTAGEQSAEL